MSITLKLLERSLRGRDPQSSKAGARCVEAMPSMSLRDSITLTCKYDKDLFVSSFSTTCS